MKKRAMRVLAIGVLLVFAAVTNLYAVTWHTANQTSVAWEPVTTLSDGSLVPATDTVEYVIYLSNVATDPDKTNPREVWQGADLTATITLNVEGQFLVGIKAVRMLADGTVVSESPRVWSDDPLVVKDGETFGVRYFLPLMAPNGLFPNNE